MAGIVGRVQATRAALRARKREGSDCGQSVFSRAAGFLDALGQFASGYDAHSNFASTKPPRRPRLSPFGPGVARLPIGMAEPRLRV